MNAAAQSIKTWFEGLKPSERQLVVAAAVLLGIAIVYWALLAPLSSAVHSREQRIERKQQDLAWMRSVAGPIQQLSASQPGANAGESLVVVIDRSARQAGISSALAGQSPNGDHGMRVRLENASFDNVVLWLSSLQQQYGIAIESASIDRADKPGIVSASIVLIRSQTP
jgi:general secretion pathway protein M